MLVLGIGNLLWADEGFGVRAVEALHRRYTLPASVTVMDGGTQGLYLLPYVQGAKRLLVFDAIDYGLPPGTLKRVRDAEVPRFTGAKKMSLHQTGFQDVLSAAELLGGLPEAMLLIGVQAERLDDWGGCLTGRVAAQIEPAVVLAVEALRAWGIALRPRAASPGEAQGVLRLGLDREGFEWRPAPWAAEGAAVGAATAARVPAPTPELTSAAPAAPHADPLTRAVGAAPRRESLEQTLRGGGAAPTGAPAPCAPPQRRLDALAAEGDEKCEPGGIR